MIFTIDPFLLGIILLVSFMAGLLTGWYIVK